jgi:hypothetical protein
LGGITRQLCATLLKFRKHKVVSWTSPTRYRVKIISDGIASNTGNRAGGLKYKKKKNENLIIEDLTYLKVLM